MRAADPLLIFIPIFESLLRLNSWHLFSVSLNTPRVNFNYIVFILLLITIINFLLLLENETVFILALDSENLA